MSYSVSDIQHYLEYIIKKHKTFNDNLLVRIYVNKTKSRITFKMKTGYNLESLTPERMKLLGSSKSTITKDKNGENASHLKITEIVLIYCKIVNKGYQQDSKVLYIFVPDKSLG